VSLIILIYGIILGRRAKLRSLRMSLFGY